MWREIERVGVHCEQQIVGARVVEVAQVPGALLFHGAHSLSVKTAQPCRQLCSGGCGGEGRGEREERTFVFHFAPHLNQCPHFSPGSLYSHSTQISVFCHVWSFYLQKYHKKTKALVDIQHTQHNCDNIYTSVCLVCVCFCRCQSNQTM